MSFPIYIVRAGDASGVVGSGEMLVWPVAFKTLDAAIEAIRRETAEEEDFEFFDEPFELPPDETEGGAILTGQSKGGYAAQIYRVDSVK